MSLHFPLRCLVHILRETTVKYSKIRSFHGQCQLDLCRHEVRYGCLREDECFYAHSLVELKVWILQNETGRFVQDWDKSPQEQAGFTEWYWGPFPIIWCGSTVDFILSLKPELLHLWSGLFWMWSHISTSWYKFMYAVRIREEERFFGRHQELYL